MTIIEKTYENEFVSQKIDALHVYALHWFHNYCWKEIERLRSTSKLTTMLFNCVMTINNLHDIMKTCTTLINKAQDNYINDYDSIMIKQIYAEFEKLHTFESVEDNDDD